MTPSRVGAVGVRSRQRWEVADVIRQHGTSYCRQHPLPHSQLRIMADIESCRTAVLGGHVEQCDQCGFQRISYNSCRNRHCPKCQSLAKAEWLERRKTELLPVPYFHNVFTLPHELNDLALCNKKMIFDLLFQTVAETLQAFARDPRHGLEGRIGFTAIIHTWNQRLLDHIHLHCLIPGGALSFDGQRWVPARRNFLFPVKALSKVFRGKFIAHLQNAFNEGKMSFPGQLSRLATAEGFAKFIAQLRMKEWVVYSKAPFDGPEKTLDYLGRYTHRVAIANHRLVSVGNDTVTFRYRDRQDADRLKEMTLSAHEFIRRFLLHTLPNSFMRIRHFGFLANRCKQQTLSRCRMLLGLAPRLPEVAHTSTEELLHQLTGTDLTKCPCCPGKMIRVAQLSRPPPAPDKAESS